MADDVTGVIVEEKKRPKGRGRGLSSLRSTKDSDTRVGTVPSAKEKEVKYTEEAKEEKASIEENYKQRGTKVRKTKAGYEPYQVKKNRPLNTSANSDTNKSHSGGEREHKQTQSPSQKRSNSTWKYDHQRTNEKYYDKNYEQKNQTNYEQKNPSQNKPRSNNNNKRNNNYRTYTNKEKQKQSRRKKGGNENVTPNNDRINNRKNIMQESGEIGSLQDKTNIRRHVNEQMVTGYLDNIKDDIKYEYNDTELKDISENIPRAVTNNKYIELDHENKVGLSLSLSNSEPEIMYAKDGESGKSSDVALQNVDLDIDIDENSHSIQIDTIESPSEAGSVTTEVNNLTMEEINIIKEMDNKRRVQGIGILECPCSLSLDGERVGYCDAHDLIAEHNETIASTTMSSEAINNSELCHNHTTADIIVIDDSMDPIDEIYLTISPIHADEELESNPPSDVEIIDISEDHSSITNDNFLTELNESCNLESLNGNEYISPNNIAGYNMSSDYVSDNYNGTDRYNDADIYVTESYNRSDVYSEDFPSPITLETSRNIDIDNINALFMNLGRRQSYNSFNSSSFDSKINSSCEKTWRSMDDFSPIDLTSRKSPSVISISSDTSEEVINRTKDNCNIPLTSHNIQYTDCEIDDSTNTYISSSKSETSLTSGTLFAKSNTSSGNIVSNKVSYPRSYPSLCDNSSSKTFSLRHEKFSTDCIKSAEKPSVNNSVKKVEKHSIATNHNESTKLKERSLMSIVSILNVNKNIDEQNKRETNEKRKLFYSYSEDNKNDGHKYSEERSRPRRYSEGRNDRCRHSKENLSVETPNKEKLYAIENQNKEEHYSIENRSKDKKEQTKNQGTKIRRNPKKLTRTISNDSSNHESSGSTSDVKEAQDINEKNCDKQNSNDNTSNSTDSKTAGVIMLPNSNYIEKSKESTPEKQERSLYLSNISYEQSGRRHVRFSSHTADSRFSTPTSTKHDDDSYMVREYMNTIKDKQFQLKKLLQRGFQSLESVNVMLEMSEAIQQKFGELIVHNQEYSFRHNFENFLWKLAFYSIIAKFRAFLEDQDVPHTAIQKIGVLYWDFLQNGIQFLDSIIVQLQKQAHFDLNHYLKDPIKIASCNKQVKFALRSCHLLLIFMGDLERYVSQFLQQEDYRNAKKYYKEAQILTPKNGKSYNQLAVVAVVTKHKLDAVYYYARSLQVSIPFLTAKDRLTAIFQEIQKKATKLKQVKNYGEVVKNTNHISKQPESNFTKRNNIDHLRDEVWIFYRNNQMFKVMLTDQNEIIDLTPTAQLLKEESILQTEAEEHSKLSLKEINRCYMILFLFVHCKLYTNIGLEEFTYVHQETLSDLTTLLRYPKASSIRKENLLKCIVINIFSVHNIMEKNGHEDLIPNTALDLAIIFGMDMIAVLCKHCVHLFQTKQGVSAADQFLPAIRVWIQWLITHSELVRKSTASAMFDIWLDICEFFNTIISMPLDKDVIFNSEGSENVYLEEDLLLAGLKSLNNTLIYCSPQEGRESEIVSQLRLENMLELTKRLDDCGNLPFAFDEKESIYKPVLSTIASSSPVKKIKILDVEDEIEALADVIIEDDDEEELGDMSHVDELKAQKASLTKQIQESEFARQAAMAVLESHKLQGRHLSENSPTYLVADTNCYIDHLNYIATILKSKDFTIIVPLIVINELDGLKKGSYFDESKFHEHQRKVQESARLAVDFLEDQFSQFNTNLRAITSNGSEMDTIVFRVEEFSDDRGTNDDVILSCCLRYCKEHKVRTEDDTNVIAREVVLLTNDRNLRLKAHTRVVPTVDISTFIRMAKFT